MALPPFSVCTPELGNPWGTSTVTFHWIHGVSHHRSTGTYVSCEDIQIFFQLDLKIDRRVFEMLVSLIFKIPVTDASINT